MKPIIMFELSQINLVAGHMISV